MKKVKFIFIILLLALLQTTTALAQEAIAPDTIVVVTKVVKETGDTVVVISKIENPAEAGVAPASQGVSVAAPTVSANASSNNGPQEFTRGIEQISFVPKGQWITGVSVSYSQSNQRNYQFLVIENISGDTYSFKVSPMLMYAFANDLAAGGRFVYSRQRSHLNKADVVLASDTQYNVDNLYSISHSYYGTLAFRAYMSLGSSTRFGIVNEVQLEIGGGQSKLCNGTGADLTGTYERNFSAGIGLSPGLMMFLNNYSAIEVNVGVLGFDYKTTKSTTDQICVAHRDMRSANFRINLFSIMFGVTLYL